MMRLITLCVFYLIASSYSAQYLAADNVSESVMLKFKGNDLDKLYVDSRDGNQQNNNTKRSEESSDKELQTKINAGPQWSDIEKMIKGLVNNVLSQFLPAMVRTTSSVDLSGSCYSSLLKLIFGVRRLRSWAIRMLDASGKITNGILDGSSTDFGSYDQCLNVIVSNRRSKEINFRGKYCFLQIHPEFPSASISPDSRLQETVFHEISENTEYLSEVAYLTALCVPSTCTTEDIEKLAKKVLQDTVRVSVPHCEDKSEKELTKEQIGVLSLLGTILFFVTLGTVLDLWKHYQSDLKSDEGSVSWKGQVFNFYKSFSIFTNGKELLNTKVGSGSLGAVHGMRFLTILWVILAHTYMFPDFSIFKRLVDFRDAPKSVSFLVVWNSWLQVDTFFFLTGLTLTYTSMKKLAQTNGRLDIVRYVVHRYWRLTPPLMLVISLVFLLPLLSSGPLWYKFVEPEIQNCRDTWWANALYVSNFMGLYNVCLGPTWYLAADMQMYLISPIVLIALYRWPRIGIGLATLGILVSWVIIAVVTMSMGFPPSVVISDIKTVKEMTSYVHFMPYVHLGPYCVGIILGYLLQKHKNMKVKQVVVVLGWIVTTISCLAVVFGAYDWHNGIKPNIFVKILYSSVHRSVFALGLAWIIFACTNGYGGPVNALLAWKPFIVLGRLTYMIYLVHSLVLLTILGSVREKQFFSHFELACKFLVYLAISIGVASVLYLIFESPFLKLERFILPRVKSARNVSTMKQNGEVNHNVIPASGGQQSLGENENISTFTKL
ncbi:nose resistant to fluoxetine protein 6-like isoform X2 [Tachypleus tridentatus]|uniref:nose resistant to fluoxetine protein 6-like isoform X2 n=1 Tax=Tachypleus tridentatus TaxID=6853 RepID=UPI003FD2A3FB